MKIIVSLLFVFITSAAVHGQKYTGDEQEIEQILANVKSFSRFVMNSQYDSIAGAYTHDAKIMPAGPRIIEGYEKIRKYWTSPGGVSTIYHEVFPEEITITGEYAHDYGYYKGTTKKADGTEASWQGKYVIVWKKEAGDWKIYLDIWNRVNQ